MTKTTLFLRLALAFLLGAHPAVPVLAAGTSSGRSGGPQPAVVIVNPAQNTSDHVYRHPPVAVTGVPDLSGPAMTSVKTEGSAAVSPQAAALGPEAGFGSAPFAAVGDPAAVQVQTAVAPVGGASEFAPPTLLKEAESQDPGTATGAVSAGVVRRGAVRIYRTFQALGQRFLGPESSEDAVTGAASRSSPFLNPSYKGGAMASQRPSLVPGTVQRTSVRGSVHGNWTTKLRAAALALAMGLGTLGLSPATLAQQPPAPPAAAQVQEVQVLRVETSEQALYGVISQWSPGARLIIVGRPDVSQSKIDGIKKEIAGSHWTVVLIENSYSLRYKDADGVSQRNYEAVKHAMGQGLNKDAKYAASEVDPRTGQQDGVIFTVIFRTDSDPPRYMTFTPSEAQKAVGLTADAFSNGFISIPRGRLQDGGDLVGAVRELMRHVNGQVNNAVESAFESGRAAIARAERSVSSLEAALARSSKSHPGVEVSRADISAMKSKIAQAQAALRANKPGEAAQLASSVAAQAEMALEAIQGYEQSVTSARNAFDAATAEVNALESSAKSLRDQGKKGSLTTPDTRQMRADLKAAQAQIESQPRQAAQTANAVLSQAKALNAEISGYSSNGSLLKALESRLEAQSARGNHGTASSELANADKELKEGRRLYEDASSGYSRHFEAAKASLDQAEASIDRADARDRAAQAAKTTGAILFILLSFGLGLFLFLRARPLRRRVSELYGKWATGISKMDSAAYQGIERRVERFVGPASGEGSLGYAGKTAKLAEEIRTASKAMRTRSLVAKYMLAEVDKLINPSGVGAFVTRLKNAFFKGNHAEAERRMKEVVAFDPKSEVAQKMGHHQDWRDDVYGNITEQDSFKASLPEVIAEFQAFTKTADEGLSRLEAAINGLGPAEEAIASGTAAVTQAKARLDKAGSEDGLFLAPSLTGVLVPAVDKALQKMRDAHGRDPIGAMELSGAEALRMASEGKQLAEAILEARKEGGAIPTVAKAAADTAKAGFDSSWLDKKLSNLSGRAEAIAAKAAEDGVANRIEKFSQDAAALAAEAARAADLARKWAKLTQTMIPADEKTVAEARAEIGKALGLDPDKTLRESRGDVSLDPSEGIASAKKQAAAAKKALDDGDLDKAEAHLEKGRAISQDVNGVIKASLDALKAQEKTVETRRTETSRLEGQVAGHAKILESIVEGYAASVLALGTGDPVHSDGNGTVKDNIDEVEEHLQAAKDKLAKSQQAYRAGRLIEADSLLDQIAGHQEFAQFRLEEIAEKKARLEKADAENAALVADLEKTSRSYETEYGRDRRTMAPTLKALAEASKDLDGAVAAAQAEKGDPFKAAAALASVKASFERVSVMARNDRDVYAEADRSLKAAASAIENARREEARAEGDGKTDSSAIDNAQEELRRLEKAYDKAKAALAKDNNDWNDVDKEADRIASAASSVAATLKSEVAAAAEAASKISSAASKVREASGWTGSYGVYIPGSPGSGNLERARSALASGNYAEAQRQADSAYRAAASAIEDAEEEVRRKRRAEEERRRREREEEEARQRRARESYSRSSGSSGGGFGGYSSGSGGGGFGHSSSGSGGGGW